MVILNVLISAVYVINAFTFYYTIQESGRLYI